MYFFAWWYLTTFASQKKNPFTLSTNSAYYFHDRAYHQLYQFHLEGVVLASAFVSKSELFEDKHGIVQSVAPPPLAYPSPPIPLPTSKQKGLDEGLDRNGKQIVHLYLGGDETLEQILSAFCLYTACSKVMIRWGAGEPGRGKAWANAVLKSQAGNQMCQAGQWSPEGCNYSDMKCL